MTAPAETAVSIIISNWNTSELLDGALNALARTVPDRAAEIIVVDNGSVDGSPDMVRRKYPGVQLIANPRNLGFARANNQGLAAASARYVLLLGSDTVVQNGTVATLAGFLDSSPRVGAVSCRLLNPDRTPQMSCRTFPRLRDALATYLSLHFLARTYTMTGFDFYRTQRVDQPAATCLMARRELLTALRGFDERYTILYNDVDLCQRIHAAGWEIFYCADAEIIHYGSMTTRSAPPPVRLEMYRNILRYYREHAGPIAAWILTPVLIARLLLVTRNGMAFRLLHPDREGWNG
jgi:GT2 family glycosyltransferase